jgi:hypothetical protein
LELIESGVLGRGGPSAMSLGSLWVRLAGRAGGMALLRALEARTGRRLAAGG